MSKIQLSKISTCSTKNITKEAAKKKLLLLQIKLEELQNLMYAEGKQSLLVVLQGMDASGKDGVVKNVFDSVNPLGCSVYPFKHPTEIEMQHDFLWRVHSKTPPKGMIHIFNRSYYEDVLIQRVHNWIDEKEVQRRYCHINAFEQLLTQTGTTILKFYIHISKEEQLERLTERLTDPTKNWKYNKQDLEERQYWDKYMTAYEHVFEACNEVPWNIIPGDQNWYKVLLITQVVVKTLESLNMKYPRVEESLMLETLQGNAEKVDKRKKLK